jgi:hypothetical protein
MYFQKLLRLITLPLLALGMASGAPPSEAVRGAVVANRAPLQPNAFNPLPLSAVRPRGWLKRQEEIQAGGTYRTPG